MSKCSPSSNSGNIYRIRNTVLSVPPCDVHLTICLPSMLSCMLVDTACNPYLCLTEGSMAIRMVVLDIPSEYGLTIMDTQNTSECVGNGYSILRYSPCYRTTSTIGRDIC